jgi:hypothetical protein
VLQPAGIGQILQWRNGSFASLRGTAVGPQALFEVGKASIKFHREHLLEVGGEEPAGKDCEGTSAAADVSTPGPSDQDGHNADRAGAAGGAVSTEGLDVCQALNSGCWLAVRRACCEGPSPIVLLCWGFFLDPAPIVDIVKHNMLLNCTSPRPFSHHMMLVACLGFSVISQVKRSKTSGHTLAQLAHPRQFTSSAAPATLTTWSMPFMTWTSSWCLILNQVCG